MKYKELKLQQSKSLLRMAWLLEVTFCTAGFFIAYSLSTQHLEIVNINTITSPDILIGLLVFGAVALIELSKIPAVNAFLLSNTLSTKIIAAVFLLIGCFLTFESMSNGLETNLNNREIKIDEKRSDVFSLNEKILLLSSEIEEIENLSSSDIHLSSKQNLDLALEPFNEQIEDLRKRELQLSRIKDSSLVSEYKRQIDNLKLSESETLLSFNASQKQLNDELMQLNKDEQNELSKAFLSGKIIKRFNDRREVLKEEKRAITSIYEEKRLLITEQLDSINQKLSELTAPSEASLTELASISKTILKLQSEKQKLIITSNAKLDKELLNAKESKLLINKKSLDRNKFETQLLEAREELSQASESSFIHRMTARVYGVSSPADLTEKQISIISLIFIFSISSVIAIAGPILAYCSMQLKIEPTEKRGALKRTFRRMLISLRRRLMKPKVVTNIKEVEKEVEKVIEVEIEKKVYETVEVPTPVEITRFVSVPVPTEIADLPLANGISSINGEATLLGGVK